MPDRLPTVTIPLRWADIDQLGHVNNVAYLDYAGSARARLVDTGALPNRPPAAIDIEYHSPLLLAAGQVDVSHEWRQGALVQHIRAGDDVFATVTTEYERGEVHDVIGTPKHRVTPRHSDLDSSGHIGFIALYEYMQEARIGFITGVIRDWAAGGFVVARVAMTSVSPAVLKTSPYDLRGAIERVGASSVSVRTQIVEGSSVLASADSVLVGFDLDKQTSRRFTDDERAVLLEAATPGD